MIQPTNQPTMTGQTMTSSMTYSTLTSRVCQQARLAREAGISLSDASAVLAQQEAREADARALRFEGAASALSVTSHIATESDALAAGVAYVRASEAAGRDKRKPNAWNTIGHVESDQPFAALHALACAQSIEVNGVTHHYPLSKTGRPLTNSQEKRARKGPRKAARKRSDGQVMTPAERTALSKWRKRARTEGFVCSEHGPSLKGCTTDCRTAALDLTGTSKPVAVATSADRGW